MSEIAVGQAPQGNEGRGEQAKRFRALVSVAADNPGEWVSMPLGEIPKPTVAGLTGAAFISIFGEYTQRDGIVYVRVNK